MKKLGILINRNNDEDIPDGKLSQLTLNASFIEFWATFGSTFNWHAYRTVIDVLKFSLMVHDISILCPSTVL